MEKRRKKVSGPALGLLFGAILSGLRAEPVWIPIGLCLGLGLNCWLPGGPDEGQNEGPENG